MKKRSSKLAKLENNRFSIITDKLDTCIICGKPKDNLHEVFFGKNRQMSMKYGCVIPLCYTHHLIIHSNHALDIVWKIKLQEAFEKTYPDIEFLKVFGKNYK